jgi:hypothetical protein
MNMNPLFLQMQNTFYWDPRAQCEDHTPVATALQASDFFAKCGDKSWGYLETPVRDVLHDHVCGPLIQGARRPV